jgi:integrase
MAVCKDKNTGKWRVVYRYTDFKGDRKQTQKRGFATKREATAWEREVMLKKGGKLDMTFESFVELYEEDKKRLKESTTETKLHIIRTKIMPYFGKRKIADIEARDVIAWQNELLEYRKENGDPYSNSYLKTIHAQLSAIFNHAVKYYKLPCNPAQQAGSFEKEPEREMEFWTKEEYLQFSEAMMDKPRSYYAFEMLYWCGIRSGELLCLTSSDFDFEKQTVRISKTFHRLNRKDIITTPKTPKSNRIVIMPEFLCEEMKDYIGSFYDIKPNERLFSFTKSYLNHEIRRGVEASGVKKIRVHDLRHSHVSLLINMGFTALAIGDRVGHEAEKITYRYAHLFPTVQTEMAKKLDIERMKKED